jgi:hypothetical protein
VIFPGRPHLEQQEVALLKDDSVYSRSQNQLLGRNPFDLPVQGDTFDFWHIY